MKFDPKQPDHHVNVTPTHPLVEAGALVLGLVSLMAIGMVVLFFFIDRLVLLIPPESEAKLFASIDLADVFLDEGEQNETQQPYVQSMVDALASHWQDAPYAFNLVVSNEPDANAFALPGGTIIVTQGLLDSMRSENELAFVLGHELGHFKHRDHMRGLGRGLALAMLSAWVFKNEVGVNALSHLSLNSFNREQEYQADAFGLTMQHRHYGHVQNSWCFLQSMAEEDGLAQRLSYLSTHPAAKDRVEKIKQLALDQQMPMQGPIVPLSFSPVAP